MREYRTWTGEERASEPNYTDPTQVRKDINLENKGNLWFNQSGAISAAREAIRKRRHEWIHYDRRERRREVLEQSKALADGLLDALKGDHGLLSVFGEAGVRMEERATLLK